VLSKEQAVEKACQRLRENNVKREESFWKEFGPEYVTLADAIANAKKHVAKWANPTKWKSIPMRKAREAMTSEECLTIHLPKPSKFSRSNAEKERLTSRDFDDSSGALNTKPKSMPSNSSRQRPKHTIKEAIKVGTRAKRAKSKSAKGGTVQSKTVNKGKTTPKLEAIDHHHPQDTGKLPGSSPRSLPPHNASLQGSSSDIAENIKLRPRKSRRCTKSKSSLKQKKEQQGKEVPIKAKSSLSKSKQPVQQPASGSNFNGDASGRFSFRIVNEGKSQVSRRSYRLCHGEMDDHSHEHDTRREEASTEAEIASNSLAIAQDCSSETQTLKKSKHAIAGAPGLALPDLGNDASGRATPRTLGGTMYIDPNMIIASQGSFLEENTLSTGFSSMHKPRDESRRHVSLQPKLQAFPDEDTLVTELPQDLELDVNALEPPPLEEAFSDVTPRLEPSPTTVVDFWELSPPSMVKRPIKMTQTPSPLAVKLLPSPPVSWVLPELSPFGSITSETGLQVHENADHAHREVP